MIEKISDNPQSNSLRVISKYEEDYNLTLKYVWPHHATQHAENNYTIDEYQWGTKPFCNANNVALLSECITEINPLSFTSLR